MFIDQKIYRRVVHLQQADLQGQLALHLHWPLHLQSVKGKTRT